MNTLDCGASGFCCMSVKSVGLFIYLKFFSWPLAWLNSSLSLEHQLSCQLCFELYPGLLQGCLMHARFRSSLDSWVGLHTDSDMFFFSCYFWILSSCSSSYWRPEIGLFLLHSRTLEKKIISMCSCVCTRVWCAHACGCRKITSGFVSQVTSTLFLETESFHVA